MPHMTQWQRGAMGTAAPKHVTVSIQRGAMGTAAPKHVAVSIQREAPNI